jgi:Tfp pilus assembly protein PilW
MFAKAACKTTSTSRRARANSAAFSLVEMVVAMGLAMLLGTGILILSLHTGRSMADMVSYVDLDHSNRMAMDRMSKEIRQVSEVTSFSSNAVTFIDKDGTPLSYIYSPAERTLTRVKDNVPATLLEQCDKLTFAVYQRTPLAGRYDLIPATSPSKGKVLTVTWKCSRSILRANATTEQGQTAKIVIRNKRQL